MKEYTICGTLEMPDGTNTYILRDADGEITNLTAILDSCYLSPSETLYPVLAAEILCGGKCIFREEGFMQIRKEERTGIYCYHVDGENLDNVLFNNTGKELIITLDLAEDKS
jgi:hypothetical protein